MFYCRKICPEGGPIAIIGNDLYLGVSHSEIFVNGNVLRGILHQVVSRGGSMVMS